MQRFCALALFLVASLAGMAETIDGIAATVDDQVITVSDLDRFVAIELIPRSPDETADAYRKRMLQHLIERILQRRDIRRFSTIEVSPELVTREMDRLEARHGSAGKFDALLGTVDLTREDVRTLIEAEIEVRRYIDERFAPLVFVPLEDIERYYGGQWSQQRREQGLGVPPLAEVRETLRDLLRAEQLTTEVDRWTRQLRSRANVDVFVYR